MLCVCDGYRQYENSVQEQDTLKRNAIEQAGRAQEQGKVFLHETMERHRQVEAREREKERNHLEERVKAILSLKNNTESAKVLHDVRMTGSI